MPDPLCLVARDSHIVQPPHPSSMFIALEVIVDRVNLQGCTVRLSAFTDRFILEPQHPDEREHPKMLNSTLIRRRDNSTDGIELWLDLQIKQAAIMEVGILVWTADSWYRCHLSSYLARM